MEVWSGQAEDLWGVREPEAVGRDLLVIDWGLPTEGLEGPIRSVLAGGSRTVLSVDAVNRRGRPIGLQVTVTPLRSGPGSGGALLLMEPLDTGPLAARRDGGRDD